MPHRDDENRGAFSMTTGELERPRPKRRPQLVLFGYKLSAWRLAVLGLAIMLAAALSMTPAPEGMPQQAMIALGLIAMTVVLWATMAIPPPTAAAMFIVLVLATGTAPPAITIS